MDVICEMIAELRTQLPPLPELISSGDARQHWLHAMGGLIRALPTRQQRTAAVIQAADDLVTLRYPGLPISMVTAWLCGQWGIEPEEMTLEEETR
jgi:hypothetical protein